MGNPDPSAKQLCHPGPTTYFSKPELPCEHPSQAILRKERESRSHKVPQGHQALKFLSEHVFFPLPITSRRRTLSPTLQLGEDCFSCQVSIPRGSDGEEAAYSAGDPGQEDPLEKGMATHSSILAWRLPRP